MTNWRATLIAYVRSNRAAEAPPRSGKVERSAPPPVSSGRSALVAIAAASVALLAVALTVRETDIASFLAGEQVPELTVLASDGGSEHLPNEQASDWVTYADHVVVVTPVAEEEGANPDDAGKEGGVIPRELTLRVDDVIWSRDDPVQPAPDLLRGWDAWGWTFTGGDISNRGRLVTEGTPRIELGHSYIIAIEWQEERCGAGDRTPAQWLALGSSAVVPFDNGIVGEGEFEGSFRTAEEAKAAADPDDPQYSFADEMAGRSGDAVRRALEQTEPEKRKKFSAPAPCPY